MTDIFIYIIIALSSFVNIIIPVSGSATITPFLAILTDPHTAIALASFFFLLSGIVRVCIFWKDIQWHEMKALLPASLVAALVSSLFLVAINDVILLSIVLAFTVYFFLKKLWGLRHTAKTKTPSSHYTGGLIGAFSGFLQGAGLAGSSIRNSYLLSNNLNISELHGTTAFIGGSIFLLTTIVRLLTDQVTIPVLLPLVYIFPLIVLATLLGRKILYRLSKRTTNIIVLIVMLAIILFLAQKVLTVLFS